jgi:hypothetical protein
MTVAADRKSPPGRSALARRPLAQDETCTSPSADDRYPGRRSWPSISASATELLIGREPRNAVSPRELL